MTKSKIEGMSLSTLGVAFGYFFDNGKHVGRASDVPHIIIRTRHGDNVSIDPTDARVRSPYASADNEPRASRPWFKITKIRDGVFGICLTSEGIRKAYAVFDILETKGYFLNPLKGAEA